VIEEWPVISSKAGGECNAFLRIERSQGKCKGQNRVMEPLMPVRAMKDSGPDLRLDDERGESHYHGMFCRPV
jgi:hypothetical protein